MTNNHQPNSEEQEAQLNELREVGGLLDEVVARVSGLGPSDRHLVMARMFAESSRLWVREWERETAGVLMAARQRDFTEEDEG